MKKGKDDTGKLELEALKSQLARALADYDNLQKRTDRQRIELMQSASSRIVTRLLPILDMLENAQHHLADPGLAITIKEFKELLQLEGFEEMKVNVGDKFDEQNHEAIDVLETKSQDEDNTIGEVSLTGWKQFEGQPLRVAKVKVKKFKQVN